MHFQVQSTSGDGFSSPGGTTVPPPLEKLATYSQAPSGVRTWGLSARRSRGGENNAPEVVLAE